MLIIHLRTLNVMIVYQHKRKTEKKERMKEDIYFRAQLCRKMHPYLQDLKKWLFESLSYFHVQITSKYSN